MPLYPAVTNITTFDPSPVTLPIISNLTIGIAAVSILPANPTRKGFSIQNNGNRPVAIGIANTVSLTANHITIIPAGGFYESPDNVITGQIFAIGGGANLNVQVTELNP
jgi:hypothetical protein